MQVVPHKDNTKCVEPQGVVIQLEREVDIMLMQTLM